MMKKNFIYAVIFICLLSNLYSNNSVDKELEKIRSYHKSIGSDAQFGATDAFINKYYLNGGSLYIPVNIDPAKVKDITKEVDIRQLPKSFNWQTLVGLTLIKGGASCGSCWAFATMGCFENGVKIFYNKDCDFSEQYLISCNKSGYSCAGGWESFATLLNGAPYESCYPYTATDSKCLTKCPNYYPLKSWGYVDSVSGVANTDKIKAVVYKYGLVFAAVYVDAAFSAYTGGVFEQNSNGNVNHAICIVGWDDTKGSKGAWRIRNNWSTIWGEQGYMWIGYGVNSVGYRASFCEFNNEIPLTPTPTLTPIPLTPSPTPNNNLAPLGSVIASSYISGYNPQNVNDNDLSTAWGTEASKAPYIYVDLKKSYPIIKIIVRWYYPYFAKKYKIGAVINGKWQTLDVKSTGSDDEFDISQYNVSSQYIGVQCLEDNAGYYGIKELIILER